ncbi:hypothetical protein PVAP13_7NG161334 [Panicum virgatum]|uniref:Uncharacterized protein n=1 Tax=Panicum virgatum TaxID=38727 RepID=A0A8T0PS18_PANVG|nr:hypothetical protein PVAP13_7NG161334 [Panicum virgatum]
MAQRTTLTQCGEPPPHHALYCCGPASSPRRAQQLTGGRGAETHQCREPGRRPKAPAHVATSPSPTPPPPLLPAPASTRAASWSSPPRTGRRRRGRAEERPTPTAERRASPAPSAHGQRPLRARPHPPAAVVERKGRTASARAVSPPLSPARARIRVWPCPSASTSSPTEPHFSLGSRDQGLSKSYFFFAIFGGFSGSCCAAA